jgi:hypothetical protein
MRDKFDEANLHFVDPLPIEENVTDFVTETAQRIDEISRRSIYHTRRSEFLQKSKVVSYEPKMRNYRKVIKSQLRLENLLTEKEKRNQRAIFSKPAQVSQDPMLRNFRLRRPRETESSLTVKKFEALTKKSKKHIEETTKTIRRV